jgi:predicted nucleic acid-binding protein
MAGLAVVLDTNALLSGLALPRQRARQVACRLALRGAGGGAVEESELTDRDDLPVLCTLLAALPLGLAETLVTGDKALLTLRDRYPIRTPAEFWAVHGGL